jgi:hypothetical protein
MQASYIELRCYILKKLITGKGPAENSDFRFYLWPLPRFCWLAPFLAKRLLILMWSLQKPFQDSILFG